MPLTNYLIPSFCKIAPKKENEKNQILTLVLTKKDSVFCPQISIVGANLGMTGKMISTPFEAIDVGLGTYLAPSGGCNTKYEIQMFVFDASL